MTEPQTVSRRLVALVAAMRQHGLHVGTAETVTAAQAADLLGLQDRERLRAGLATSLLRSPEGRPAFDALFDLYFPAAEGKRSTTPSRMTSEELRDRLAEALAGHDARALDELAAAAVDLFGRIPGDAADRGWSSAQTVDRLAPQRAIAAAEQRALAAGGMLPGNASGQSSDHNGARGQGRGSGEGSPQGGQGGGGAFADRLLRDEMRSGVAGFTKRVEAEARRRNTEVRDRDRIARYGVASLSAEREFLGMGSGDLAQLRREIDPLAHRLAAKLDRRRNAGRGQIDIRRTLRAATGTGGVPLHPAYTDRVRHRPDLVALADLSGSVGGFSGFTMLLMQALQAQFRRVRLFGFVSSTAEITDLVKQVPPGVSITAWALQRAELTARGRSSSYGSALHSFRAQFGDTIGPRSTLLILGDARSNYGDPALDQLTRIVRDARHAAWLNPEPAGSWGQGDSLAHVYGRVINMHECRTVTQLRRFVATSLPVS